MPSIPEVYPCAFCPHSTPFRPLVLRVLRYFLLLLIAQPLALINLQAQSGTATLTGTIVDQAGAVVPGVNISVISITQAFHRSATTNDEGGFVVPALPPGNYTVKAERQGFNTMERNVTLNVNEQASITMYLKVGDIAQTIEIVDNSNPMDPSPVVNTVVDQQFVDNLPLNGRSIQTLIGLAPGFVLTKTNNENQGQFSVNGQRSNSNYFMIDGVGANIGVSPATNVAAATAGTTPGLAATGGTNNLVSVDAVQEFNVLTSTFAPEFGRTPGAQVQILTRAGTSKFHGRLFEYLRNDVFDAADWFRNATRQPRTALRQHDFGGVLGGPLYLPRFGEGGPAVSQVNRTFFFFSYEGLRLRLPQTSALLSVPSLNARTIAPPGVRDLLRAYPLPNGRDLPNNLAEFSAAFSDPSSLDATSLRIDHHVSDKLTLFARYNYSPSEAQRRNGLAQVTHSAYKTQTLTAGATFVINADITNDLRANYSWNKGRQFNVLDNFGGAVPPPDSLLFSGFGDPETGNFFTSIGGTSAGFQRGTFGVDVQRQINLVDTLSVIKGNHHLKFGVDYRRLNPIFDRSRYFQQVIFPSVTGAITTARTTFAQTSTYFETVYPLFTNLSLFAQDNWTLSSRLTLTYGSRWEFNPPPTEATGNDPAPLTGLNSAATLALAPAGTPLYKTSYNNFAPRLGVAYRLSKATGRETMLRAGIGIFYDLGTGPAATAFSVGFPYFRLRRVSSAPYPLSVADATPPSPFPNPPIGNVGSGFGGLDPEFKLPYTYQWNVSLEQALGAHQSVTVSYVAAVGRRLVRQEFLFGPNSTFDQVRLIRNLATSDYHSLQLQFQRRLTRGLQALGSYTWSHSIDNVSSDATGEAPSFLIDPRNERGPSDFDVRHSANAALSYDLPAPGKDTFINPLIRNFSLDGTFTARTATPVNIITGASPFGGNQIARPDLVTNVPLYVDDPTAPGGWRINRAAFTIPVNRQGTLGRNALRGFPLWQFDLSLRRQFNLNEHVNLQFRAEIFNLFNHPNFGDPVGNVTLPRFGFATTMLGRSLGAGGTSGGFNPLYQVGGPRSIQLSLKLAF